MSLDPKKIALYLSIATFSLGCGGSSNEEIDLGSGGGDDDPITDPAPAPSPTTEPTPVAGKVWTIAEILAEPRSGGGGGEPKCGGEFGFKRCLCPEDVPSTVRYRPAVEECNGNAAAILDGKYEDIFSIVVRDSQNRDRWPASGFNGCSASLANSESPPNSCSAFKVQDRFAIGGGAAQIHCFGASGYDPLFSDVVRLTAKLEDSPNSNDDPLERFCLYSHDEPLN